MYFKNISLFVFSSAFLFSCAFLKKENQHTYRETASNKIGVTDSLPKAVDTIKVIKPKPYKDVITSKAIIRKGLFTVDRIGQQYYFEIPDSLLETDLLLVSRIAKAAADYRPIDGSFGNVGDKIGEKVIRFSKGPGDKLFIRTISYWERSLDSSENGMYRTVHNSNVAPIVWAFDIKSYSPDSLRSVIDVTDFMNSDNGVLYFEPSYKKYIYALGTLQKDKSYVVDVASFPLNIELRKVNTYESEDRQLTYELNASFVLLPKEPMNPRYSDRRVGYFGRVYEDYDRPQNVQITRMIVRWRMEPEDADKEKYLKGELVEPKKPIVYYIDPATPKKWVPYLIQGVNDWQKAFEKAGFTNAIYALEAPLNDSTFSLFDARHNAIIYKASALENASGPQIHDPRSGEILETHVNWYHNVQALLHDWYMIQAGPNDPNARKMIFDDALMGELIRFVACHEVGHTLGLLHNFGASSTVPVDSLRSKSYVDKNGISPSIMDYARFNYVAQPEDHFSQRELFSKIGSYDKWAIEFGYRWLPQLKTREQEEEYMNKWIINSLALDKQLFYGPQFLAIVDPRSQTEDLGDDAMKAGFYGIQNLKKVVQHLKDWTKEPNTDYASLERMYSQLIDQYFRYVTHVANNIRLGTVTFKTVEQAGPMFGFVPKEKQKKAVAFLQEQLFDTPQWLDNKEIFSLVQGPGTFLPLLIQQRVIGSLISYRQFVRMYGIQTKNPGETYSFDELLTDLEKGIWKEITNHEPVDNYRRNLQKIYIEQLIEGSMARGRDAQSMLIDDGLGIFTAHLKKLQQDIDKALPTYKDGQTRWHLTAISNQIKQALAFNPYTYTSGDRQPANSVNGFEFQDPVQNLLNCWSNGLLIDWNIGQTFNDMLYKNHNSPKEPTSMPGVISLKK